MFSFDRVFYEKSEQVEVYEFLALPIVRGIISETLLHYEYKQVF
jgi:hypothetical protein